MDSQERSKESILALNELYRDLYKQKVKENAKLLIACFVLAGMLLVSIIFSCCLLMRLNAYEQVTITETTTEGHYTNDIDGDDANVVNGDQYNYSDEAVHNQTNN